MGPDPSVPVSWCKDLMVSCPLYAWGLYWHNPISTMLCPHRRPLTWNYAHLGAWDTFLAFERWSLVPLRINNAEIHVSETLPNCHYLSFLVICTPAWRDRYIIITTLETASHCRYPSEGKCFVFQRHTKSEWTGISPIFFSAILWNGEMRPIFLRKLYLVTDIYVCKIYHQTHDVGLFALPTNMLIYLF